MGVLVADAVGLLVGRRWEVTAAEVVAEGVVVPAVEGFEAAVGMNAAGPVGEKVDAVVDGGVVGAELLDVDDATGRVEAPFWGDAALEAVHLWAASHNQRV